MAIQKLAVFSLALAMALTARADVFRGRVVDAKNQPIANAEVLVQSSQEDQPEFAYSTLHTDAQGNFSATLAHSSYSADYFGRIYAVASGMAPNCVPITTINKYKTTILQLLPAETISGRVTDQKGKPAAKVAVQLTGVSIKSTFPNVYLGGMPWAKRYEAVTDKNGHWQIEGVPSGMKASVSIDDPRFVKMQWDAFPGAPSATTIRPGANLTGRVVDDKGNPLAKVSVGARTQDYSSGGSAVSAADGSYRITGLASGLYTISARVSDKKLVTSGIANQTAQEGQTEKVPDVIMIPGAIITGQVVNQRTDKPVIGVSINGANVYDSTDADGRYSLRVPPGAVHVSAVYAPSTNTEPDIYVGIDNSAVDITVIEGQTVTQNFALDPGETASGIAVDRQGKPVAGAIITVGSSNMFGTNSTITGADGRWKVQGLEQGNMDVQAQTPWAIVKPMKVTLPQTGDVHVVLQKIKELPPSGRVVGINNKPLAGVTLQLGYISADATTGMSERSYSSVISDSKGNLQFFPPFGTTSIIVTKVENPDYTLASAGKWNAKTRRLSDIVLDRLNNVVRGRVLDERGKPAANIRVEAAGFEKAVAQTNKSGEFVLTGLPHQQVTVLAIGKSTFGSTIPKNTNAELHLMPLRRNLPSQKQSLDLLANLWRSTTDKTFPQRPQMMGEIAKSDPARALALLKNVNGKIPVSQISSLASALREMKSQDVQTALDNIDGKVSAYQVYYVIASLSQKFPALALQWGGAHLDAVTQDDDRVQVLCQLAKLAAGTNNALAQKYFSQAAALAQIFPAPTQKTYSSDESLESPIGKFLCTRIFMAGAAAKVHPQQTRQWMEQIFPYSVDPNRGTRNDYDWARDLMAQELAVSAPEEVELLMQNSTDRMKIMEIGSAVRTALYEKNVNTAQHWLDQLTQMYTQNKQPATANESLNLTWGLGAAAREMIDAVGPKDPARAMKLARLVEDNAQTGRSLLLAGQYQSKETKLKAWNEAFNLLKYAPQSGKLTSILASKIYDLDTARGKVLLDQLLQSNSHPDQNSSYQGDLQASDLAAAIARYQPITSWQMLQNSWAVTAKNPQAQWVDYVDLAVAMSAVDFTQSMQWARHISATMGVWGSTTSYPASNYAQYKILKKTLASSKGNLLLSSDVF
jgi:protocatechuate 3,4-dioxygenase beta subunit